VGQAIVSRRLPFDNPADFCRRIVLIVILIDGLVDVIVVSHHTGDHHDRKQEREEHQSASCNPPIVVNQIGRDGNDQSGGGDANAQLPWPEHQIEMILTADLAPDGEDRLQRDQEFHDQQRAEQAIGHCSER
jgi:hypothetical protein